MQGSLKSNSNSCTVGINSFCIKVLKLLRQRGLIYGFSFVSSKYSNPRLVMTVRIDFKYTDHNTPVLKGIKAFPNTHSNWTVIKKTSYKRSLAYNKLYILTLNEGLIITSSQDTTYSPQYKENALSRGKLLAVLSI